jgi:hypothetical protein
MTNKDVTNAVPVSRLYITVTLLMCFENGRKTACKINRIAFKEDKFKALHSQQ